MNMLMSVYTKKAFKEYLLPAVNNTDFSVTLFDDCFQIEEDIQLNMEVIDNCWKIKETSDYSLSRRGQFCFGEILKDGDVLELRTKAEEEIYIFVQSMKDCFHPFSKFSLNGTQEITVGSSNSNDIVYNYLGMVSKQHARIVKTSDVYSIINTGRNGIYINSSKIEDECPLEFGMYINILGLHMVFLGDILAVDTISQPVNINSDKLINIGNESEKKEINDEEMILSEGKKLYHRAPRDYEKINEDCVEIEAPPQPVKSKQRPLYMTIGPSITMALPMLMGCVLMVYASTAEGRQTSLYMYSGLIMAVTSMAIGVIWALVNIRYQKKEEKEQEVYRVQAYGGYLEEKTKEIQEKYSETMHRLKTVYPDAESCMDYDEDKGVLWNRNRTHGDFLKHRLGLGNMPFQIDLNVPKKKFTLYTDEMAEKPLEIKNQYDVLKNVPIMLDLVEKNLVGVVGGLKKKGAVEVARIISAQVAANNCYTDVKLGYIYDEASSSDFEQWNFARWLPHVWSEDKKVRYIASTKEEASDVFYELTKIFRERSESPKVRIKEIFPKPYYIIFVSNPEMLEGEPISKYIYGRDKTFGLTTILLAERYEELPNDCDFIIENTVDFQGMYEVSDAQDEKQRITFDKIDGDKLECFSRHLSSLRVLELETGGEIPNELTFFEMMKVNNPEDLPVAELWAKNRTYDNIRGQIGQKAGGVPCYLDVHEKYHGPHGLVAGTTGSGKSETLQTYMLSLAVNYSPDDVGFFIIDYKGGGMANLFDGLPHLVGQISNLSGNQVKRAMISIKSENRRRQQIFTEHGVNNINLYTKLYKNGEAKYPIPHLFIIVDEFAELKREEPEFMKELISVAQVGRSLGVHMILSTQKPGGTVDENIWSNSKFRLCLRVQNQQESKDMLHKPDAAYITQAGRCYLQVGNDEVYELFQSGYSGADYDKDAVGSKKEIAELLTMNGRVEITGNSIKRIHKIQEEKEKTESQRKVKKMTQLDAVKEYLAYIARTKGYTYKTKLWLPVMASHIYLKEFKNYRTTAFSETHHWQEYDGEWRLEVSFGLLDDPEKQMQIPLNVNFAVDENVAILGNIISGKSTMMQTICFALIEKYTPDIFNFYALDFSSKMMAAFESVPHCGGVMFENDLDKIGKFFHMMDTILEERKELLRGGNYKQYVQIHGIKFPAILIFIDNYAAFKEKTEEIYEDMVIRLSKEGISHGIYLIISGKGYGVNDITKRVGENLKTVFCLAMQERYDYSEYLRNNQIAVLPETDIKGRGLARYGKRVLEYQTALAVEADNDYQRLEKIRTVCMEMSETWDGKNARRIPEIPAKPVWSEFSQLDMFSQVNGMRDYLAVGYNSIDASVYGIPLREIYCYLICGTPRSGKTNFMKVCIQAVLEKQARICILDSPQKILSTYSNMDGVIYIGKESEVLGFFEQLMPVFVERNIRKRQMLEEDYEEDEIFDVLSKEVPYFIFIPDLIWFVQFVGGQNSDVRGFMETMIEKGRLHNIYFICEFAMNKRATVSGYRLFNLFTEYKTGIHFGGKTADNTLLSFASMSYKEQNQTEKAGIGIPSDTNTDKVVKHIVVPLARR